MVVVPFVTLGITRIFTVLFGACGAQKIRTVYSVFSSQHTHRRTHTVGLNLPRHLVSLIQFSAFTRSPCRSSVSAHSGLS